MKSDNPNDKVKIREHEADGIQEYDNALPTWWVWLFWGAIVYGIGYLAVYHFGSGESINQEFARNMEVVQSFQKAPAPHEDGETAADSDAASESVEWATDQASIEQGKQIYLVNCIGCHGANGEGGIGPNLTDKYFIHGKLPEQYLNTVQNGILEKGMPAWGPVLGPTKTRQVTAFAISLYGTTPANAKAPQGILIE